MKDNREQFIEELFGLGVELTRSEDGVFITDMFVRVELLPELLVLMTLNEKLESS